ncbi:MAG TPA: hypothetical protein VN577_19995 [Terriglobales bacterium]|nr:hypothetical protein [Terriglobales bacterium]
MKLQVRITGAEQASADIRAAMHQGLANGIEKLAWTGVGYVQENTPTAFGYLANGITVDFAGGRNLIATIHATPPGEKYVLPVETGTRPHFPPITPLMLWVKQKFGVGDEQAARSIAFAVAQKIAKRGTKGAFMFQKATEKLVNLGPDVIEREIAEAIMTAGLA